MTRTIATKPALAAIDLCLVGLYIFTFAIVTLRYPVADIGIGVAILGLFFRNQAFRAPTFFWLICAYVLWSVLVSSFSGNWQLASESIVDRMKVAAMVLVLVNAIQSVKQFQMFLIFFVFCFMIYPIRGALLNYFVIGHTSMGRAIWNATYGNPNDLATLATLALGVMIALITIPNQNRWIKLTVGAAAIATVVTIVLTQSRGALIGIVAGFGIASVKLFTFSFRRILLVFAVIVAIAIFVPAKTWERFAGISKLTSTETIAEADPEGSAEQRFAIAKTAWKIWLDHPVFGTGLNSYKIMNYRYAPELGAKDAHNTYLDLAVEIGLPGLMIWLTIVGSVFSFATKVRQTCNIPKNDFLGIWIQRALVAFLVAGFFGTYSSLNLLYFVLALLWIAANLAKGEQTPANRVPASKKISAPTRPGS